MVRFVFALILLVAGIVAVLYILRIQEIITAYPSWFRETIFVLGLLTSAIYFYLNQPRFSDARDFSMLYLASIAIKLLAGCSFLVVVVRFDPRQAVPNALLFLICYVLFTALEVGFLWSRIQSQNGAKKG